MGVRKHLVTAILLGLLFISRAFAEVPANPDLPEPGPAATGEAATDGGSIKDEVPVNPDLPEPGPAAAGEAATEGGGIKDEAGGEGGVEAAEGAAEESYADPIEPWNRFMYHFNDKLYYWVLKPAAKGYNAVVPEVFRVSVRNFFRNITMPVRFVSAFLEGDLSYAGTELARFAINSTAGIGGLFDVAKSYNLESKEKDLGLTFGYYGMKEGAFIIWPFLGPSSVRDTIGAVGDGFLDPVSYVTPLQDSIEIQAYKYFNEVSLSLGDYEDLTEASVEPYIALRNAYLDHRRSMIKKRDTE